jgi:hypothetical protein
MLHYIYYMGSRQIPPNKMLFSDGLLEVECNVLSVAGLFAIQNGARGERGRAREELKTVRPGAATRERFLEGEGEKRFGVAAGMPCGSASAHAAAAAGAGFRRSLFAR